MGHFWAILGHFLTPFFDHFLVLPGYFLGYFWKVWVLKKGRFWVIFGQNGHFGVIFDSPFLTLFWYFPVIFRGLFGYLWFYGCQKVSFLGSKITENWIVNFDQFGSILYPCIWVLRVIRAVNLAFLSKECHKKGSKRGHFWAILGRFWPPFLTPFWPTFCDFTGAPNGKMMILGVSKMTPKMTLFWSFWPLTIFGHFLTHFLNSFYPIFIILHMLLLMIYGKYDFCYRKNAIFFGIFDHFLVILEVTFWPIFCHY